MKGLNMSNANNNAAKVLSRSAWNAYRTAYSLLGKEVLDTSRGVAVLADTIHVRLNSEILISGVLLSYGCAPFEPRHAMRVEVAGLLSVALNAAAEAGDTKYAEKLSEMAAPHGRRVEVSLPLVFPNDWPSLGDWAQPLGWTNGHDALIQEVALAANGAVTLVGNFSHEDPSRLTELSRRLVRLPKQRSLRVPVRSPLSQADEKPASAPATVVPLQKPAPRAASPIVNGDPAQLGSAE